MVSLYDLILGEAEVPADLDRTFLLDLHTALLTRAEAHSAYDTAKRALDASVIIARAERAARRQDDPGAITEPLRMAVKAVIAGLQDEYKPQQEIDRDFKRANAWLDNANMQLNHQS
ncbi:hypothetical protein [Amycolatopsis sp. DSM 110486]|uniref:hypothetical protein n=1 Tax=Amycolatopsis sp. DSM 110486 TaxID=2865832 RepID=UPI001C6A0034|nr:hypothetical protein [Amycolatopsis sp. DSM 110486]QYN17570.1 hypothetical protein K1T34_32820 [Amycolatopsis sp. DSM 110486]